MNAHDSSVQQGLHATAIPCAVMAHDLQGAFADRTFARCLQIVNEVPFDVYAR